MILQQTKLLVNLFEARFRLILEESRHANTAMADGTALNAQQHPPPPYQRPYNNRGRGRGRGGRGGRGRGDAGEATEAANNHELFKLHGPVQHSPFMGRHSTNSLLIVPVFIHSSLPGPTIFSRPHALIQPNLPLGPITHMATAQGRLLQPAF
jgi:hypothetical protein